MINKQIGWSIKTLKGMEKDTEYIIKLGSKIDMSKPRAFENEIFEIRTCASGHSLRKTA